MAQAQMQKAPAVTKQAATSPPVTQKPMAGNSGQPMEEKKMKWWMWLIIAIVVIGAGIGIYSWLM